MAIAFVQSARASTNGTSLNVGLGGVAAGNMLIVAIRVGATGRTISVNDDLGNNYLLAKGQAAAHDGFIYYAMNVAAGATTVTVGISGAAADIFAALHEYSGLATTNALDQAASATGTSTNADSGDVTTTTNNQLVFCFQAGTSAAVASIGFVAASANASAASGNLSVTPPTTKLDDIMICAVTSHDNVALSFPAGWNIYQEGNNTAVMRSTLAWKRAAGVEGAFSITHTAGDGIVANVATFRGCDQISNPISASVLTHNASSSTVTAATVSPTVNNCHLLFTMHDSDNGASSAQTSANFGGLTEIFDNASGSGLDQAVSGANKTAADISGGTGASTGTISVGPDVNSGGNTLLAPFTTQRDNPGTQTMTSDFILSSTDTVRSYGALLTSQVWVSLVATFSDTPIGGGGGIKQLALLGVG